MESLNRWLHQRQNVARTSGDPRHANESGSDETREHSRRGFTERLNRTEELVNRQELAKTWKSLVVIGIVATAVFLAILVAVFTRESATN
jgi:hypothetical protein